MIHNKRQRRKRKQRQRRPAPVIVTGIVKPKFFQRMRAKGVRVLERS